MPAYPVPLNEGARTRAVDGLDLMRRQGDPFFDAVTAQARAIFDTPIAFISLFSGDAQTFLARENVPFAGTPRDRSLCSYTVAARRTVVLADTHLDPRSLDHPVVTGEPHVRFSASAPVFLSNGFCVGTVCAIDLAPRDHPSEAQIAQLEGLATMIGRFYEVPLEPDAELAARLRAIAADAQEQFLQLVGHELRTPLNGILGLSQVIEPADDNQAVLIDAIVSSAERLRQIVENVISFSDLQSGEMTLDEEETDLAEMVAAVADEFAPLARLSGKSIEVAPMSPCPVRADAAKLGLALACLMSNVVAHGGAAARIIVERGPDGVRIRVRDDGAGIAPGQEARVWNPFTVGEAPLTRSGEGIGLGLPLTRRVVELHGGEVSIASGEGGMQATIQLPAWRTVRAEAPLAAAS